MSSVTSVTGNVKDLVNHLAQNGSKTDKTDGQTVKKEEKKNIFGGDLNLVNDPVAQKRKEAQEKAWKLVENAWKGDQAYEKNIQERQDHYDQMRQLRSEAGDELLRIGQEKEALKEQYGIKDDSQEQKDLELLEKLYDAGRGRQVSFTEEEMERCKALSKEPRTEYQQRALDLYGKEAHFRSEMEEAEKQMKDDAADIRAVKLEHLKTHGMVDAQKSADEILKAASDEIIGMLKDEALDHIDEEKEKAEEKAEETKEKKKEEEEKRDELELKRAEQEALIMRTKEAVEKAESLRNRQEAPQIDTGEMVDIAKDYAQSGDVKQSLEEIKVNMKLLDADLKGIQVDEGA